MAQVGNFLFRWRNGLFPVIVLLVVLLPGPTITGDPLNALLIGLLLCVTGQSVRAATIGVEYIIRGGKDRRVYAEKLVTEGVYSHSRNPMYVGNLLILAGVVVASNSWIAAATGVALGLFAYRAIVAAEEQFLSQKFGPAFDTYCRDVPRFWPRLKGIVDTFANSRFRWRRVMVKEYGTPAGWILALAVIGYWHLSRDGSLEGDEEELAIIGSVLLVALVAWSIARYLKKKRIVTSD